MTLVLVERAFESPREFAELRAQEDAATFCFNTHGVKYLQSFFARDRQRLVCLFDAPDAEAVRITQRVVGLPVEHVWPATVCVDRAPAFPAGYSLVVVQRALPPGITLEFVEEKLKATDGCNNRLRLEHVGSYLSHDCSRMCCIYYSPDLESVRVANRESDVPFERVWSAERMPGAG
jgi:hypothetical protein